MTYEGKYHLAEAHYLAGSSETAEKLAFELLSHRILPMVLEGDCHFLLAKIANQRGELETFLRFANLARSSYESLPERYSSRLRNLDTQIALSLIQVERYEKALFLLETIYERQHVDSHRAFVALMASDTNFWLKNLSESFAWYEKAYSSCVNAED